MTVPQLLNPLINEPVFNVGDVVCLKSGGPKMTVYSARNSEGKYKCIWFTQIQHHQADYFPEECLMLTSATSDTQP